KEHALYYGLDGDIRAPFAQDTIEILRKAGITITSTIVCMFVESLEGLPRFKAAVARTDVGGFLLPSQAEFLRKSLEKPSDQAASNDPYLKVSLANTAAAHKAGIRIVAGTDYYFLVPGLHWELELLVKAGLSPLEALRTATSNAAAVLGVEGRLGCISPGAVADLVVLEADPLEDIRNTQKIYAVIQGGRIIDRASLLNWEEKKITDPDF
ncbi:MAG: amidohydrolase family protein, partial [Candidatus Aminicenantes bacterium]|nr:amidohydrolase family protein [Candidatus Aminicenantes bacterium]